MFTNQTFPSQSIPNLQPSATPINPEIKTKSILLLNQLLANLLDLESQYRVAHWNVTGLDFYYFHQLFGKLYENTGEIVDSLAELIRSLGGMATGTARDIARDTKLNEFDISKFKSVSYLQQLNNNLCNILECTLLSAQALENIDPITNNYLLTLADTILRQIYLVESHLR